MKSAATNASLAPSQVCIDCQRSADGAPWNLFCPSCLFCGARLIRWIGRLTHVPPEQRRQRQRRVLSDWMAYGHQEQELRTLAKQDTPPVQPPGRAKNGAFVDQTPTKRR
jgi:hypothetical protein